MLPKGLFGIVSHRGVDAARVDAFVGHYLDEDETFVYRASSDGRGLVGVVGSTRYAYPATVSADATGTRIGALDGLFFEPSRFAAAPHLLAEGRITASDANGMFAAAAWDGAALTLIADPLCSVPVYYRKNENVIAFSSSLTLLLAWPDFPQPRLSFEGFAQFTQWGYFLDGGTFFDGVCRVRAGEVIRLTIPHNEITEQYWQPRFDVQGRATAVARGVDAFTAAMEGSLAAAIAPTSIALTGGFDTRCMWAVTESHSLLFDAVTHAMCEGHDAAIARHIAKAFGWTHRVVPVDARYLSELPRYAREAAVRANGMIRVDSAHLPWLYAMHAPHAATIIDGVNTMIEHRFGLRRIVRREARDGSAYAGLWKYLKRFSNLRVLQPRIAADVEEAARVVLRRLVDALPHGLSPGMAADAFHIRYVIAAHGADTALLQNHFVRFVTPFYDTRYLDAASDIDEAARSDEHLAFAILRRHCPRLLRFPRSYADIKTIPAPTVHAQRLFVGAARLLRLRPSPLTAPFRHYGTYDRSVGYEGISFEGIFEDAANTSAAPASFLSREMRKHLNLDARDAATQALAPVLYFLDMIG